jgi:hypothetical protein
MMQFSYRLALTSVLLALSVTVWWAAAAGASRYIDRPVIAPSQTQGVGGGGFDWVDAGIGAAATVGLFLAAGGAAVLVLRHRRSAAFS